MGINTHKLCKEQTQRGISASRNTRPSEQAENQNCQSIIVPCLDLTGRKLTDKITLITGGNRGIGRPSPFN